MAESRRHVRLIKSAVAVLAVVVGIVVSAANVSAQNGPTSGCDGPHVTPFGSGFFGIEENGNRLISTGPTERTYILAAPLSAGSHDINAVSYDGYTDRALVDAQPLESWFAEFLSPAGVVLATTASTGDVADLVEEATWAGPIGRVTLAEEATMVRLKHAAPGDPNSNSIRAVCIGAQPVPAELPPSEVEVNFQNEGTAAATVTLDCAGREESGTGRAVDLFLDGIEAGSQCTVVYPVELDCDIEVIPIETDVTLTDDALIVSIPADGDASIIVGITCEGPTVVDAPVDDDVDDSVADNPGDDGDQNGGTQDSSVGTEVQGQAETATPRAAQPSFTG